MTRLIVTSTILSALLLVGCGSEEPPLPDDVYEAGWDETTRSQRIQLLRRDLEDNLDTLRLTAQGTKAHRVASENAARTLSALRPELTPTQSGRSEYRALEARVESLTGDAS